MNFTRKYFDPGKILNAETANDGSVTCRFSKDNLYVYSPRLILALNIALATQRPLLLAGEPGCGKTTLARNAASVLGWWYYKDTISSRTQATDLLWKFDSLRRLNDAYTQGRGLLPDDSYYVDPGTLWWALDPVKASRRGLDDIPSDYFRAYPKNRFRPFCS